MVAGTSVSAPSMQAPQLRPAGAELVGHMPPGLRGLGVIGPREDRPDGRGKTGRMAAATTVVRAFGDRGQRGPHDMDAAPLPRGAHHPGDRRLQTLAGVGDDQLHAAQAALDQAPRGKVVRDTARPRRGR